MNHLTDKGSDANTGVEGDAVYDPSQGWPQGAGDLGKSPILSPTIKQLTPDVKYKILCGSDISRILAIGSAATLDRSSRARLCAQFR